MKDDSGTLKFINEVFEGSQGETIKKKLTLVKKLFVLFDRLENQKYITNSSHNSTWHYQILAQYLCPQVSPKIEVNLKADNRRTGTAL